jgi:hypothetical protein
MFKKIICFFFFLFSRQNFAEERIIYENWSEFQGKSSEFMNYVTNTQTLDLYIFNTYLDITRPIYNFTIPAPLPIGVGISVGGGRKVIFNKDINTSYTVIDKFQLNISPRLSGEYYGFSFGVGTPITFLATNTRQVGTEYYTKLPTIEKLIESLEERFKKEKSIKYSPMEEKTDDENYANFVPSSNIKIQRRATFGRLWNPITEVFRLPLSPRAADRMAESEILSYTLSGGIELGAGFGIGSLPNAPIFHFGVDASVYFKGIFELAVLKEKPQNPGENFVRIKIARSRGLGYALGGGVGSGVLTDFTSGKMGFLEGNFIYSYMGSQISIRPFRLSWDQSYWHIFNQVYRFDMNNPLAREAYQKAVLGRFKLAEKMAFDDKGQLKENSPVTRILTSDEKTKLRGHRRAIGLFFLNMQKEGIIKSTDKILVNQDLEKTNYFETEASSSLNVESLTIEGLFKWQENRSHKFNININLDTFSKSPRPANSLILTAEGQRGDTNTKTKEYLEYIQEVEDSLNLPELFPLPPLSNKKEWFKGSLGNTSFYYRLLFNWTLVEKFINYPEEKMWSALITAFNAEEKGWEDDSTRRKLIAKSVGIYSVTLPVTLVGAKFPPKDIILIASLKYSLWKKLKDQYLTNPRELGKALANFFNSGDYGPEMIKLLRVVLSGEKIPYVLRSFNPLMPDSANIQKDGIGDLSNPVLNKAAYAFDRYNENFEKVNITNLIVELVSNEWIRIILAFDREPKAVFFTLEKYNLTGVISNMPLGSVVISNKSNQFKPGNNIIMVKIGGNKHPLNNLINQMDVKKRFRLPNQYRLGVAATLDGKRYGHTANPVFRTIFTEDPKSLDKYIKYTAEDFNLCLGRSALNLILFLEKRPLLVCPEKAPRREDGTCIEGMYPYDYFKNASFEQNIKKRNTWIFNNCPKEGDEGYIQKITQVESVCLKKSPTELIQLLGNRPFFVCPIDFPKNPDGTCTGGIIPYQLEIEGDNLNSRNDWIIKYCSQ